MATPTNGHPPGSRVAVSVIIPVLDDADRLATCLQALERQTLELPFEVLVVDNGSSDDLAGTLARIPSARLLREPRRSSYAARNRGVSEAQGEVLAFTDSDCIPHSDWLRHGHETAMRLERPGFVAGRIDVFPRDAQSTTAAERWDLINAFPQQRFADDMHFAATANLVVRRDVFAKVGPFRDTMISSGDLEWGQRAGDHSVAAVYSPDVAVRHPARRSLTELVRKARRLAAGHAHLRRLRSESLSLWALMRPLVRPPLRTLARPVAMVEPRTVSARVSYLALAVLISYVTALEQARAELRDRARDCAAR